MIIHAYPQSTPLLMLITTTVAAAKNRDKVTDLVRVKGMNPEHMCVATT